MKVCLAVLMWSAQWSSAVAAQGLLGYNITRPLRVCTASSGNLGLRCNGAPTELRNPLQPDGPVPVDGWCRRDQHFCGNDADVWSEVADRLGLQEGRDFDRVCFGEKGFNKLIDTLAEKTFDYGICDIGASGITANSTRADWGIRFSRAIHSSSLRVLVYAPFKQRGKWAFFEPLHLHVWVGIALTVVITPIIVFFFEAIFNKNPFYAEDGKLSILRGLRECVWHSVCHTLSIDVFRVDSFPARIVTVAYAFLVLILTHTYTANLAAFLTVQQLDLSIHSLQDLQGKAVATIPTYVDRLKDNHRITAFDKDEWNYDQLVAKLRTGEYAAVISGETQLLPRAYRDQSCSLHLLQEEIEPYDLTFAFSKSFASDAFRADVSRALLDMQEDGTLTDIRERYTPPEPRCLSEATEFSETNQVEISAVWGLWIIMGGAVAASIVAGCAEWAIKRSRRRKRVEGDSIGGRIAQLGRLISGARHTPGREQAAAAAVEAVGRPGADKPTPFLQHPGKAPAAEHVGFALGAPKPGRPGLSADPRRPLRHSSSAHGNGSLASNRSRHSTISEECEFPHPVATAYNLSMHSMPSVGNASAVDSQSSNDDPGTRRDGAGIMLPGPPVACEAGGPAQQAQHGGAGAAGGQGEFRAELSEVMSMLRMVSERVSALQGAPRVHV